MFIKRKILAKIEKFIDSPEAIVITGFRRVGKSTVIKHIFDNLKTDNKLFLDLESPISQEIFKNINYDAIAVKLEHLGLNYKKSKPYIFLDEIQFVKNLPSVMKYLYDHYQIKFIVTGSSSFYLKNYFTESMAGRKFLFELMPLDFEEFLWFKGEKLLLTSNYHSLKHLYDEFMQYGGLPGVVLENSVDNKVLKLDDALGSYFQLDVVNLASFRDIKDLKSLLFLLAPRVGSKLDVTKLAESLKISRQTMYNYLEFFEETYLIHLVPAYSKSSDVIVRKVPKLYFNDSGILGRVGNVSLGQIFENAVFGQLYKRDYFEDKSKIFDARVMYYQKKSGAEIDFITGNCAYEVKLTGTKSDVRRLSRFSEKLKLQKYSVVSLEEANTEGVVYPFTL